MATQETEPRGGDVRRAVRRHRRQRRARSSRASPRSIELALLCLVSEGHLLLEDVPGVGKTSLAKALAASIDVQLRPHPVHPRPAALRRRRRHGVEPERPTRSSSGPARCSPTSCSADEINRASPKTQSALLEAMAENQVTVDGTTYPLGPPVHGHRHPEPDRARGHLPAAREPARPLPHAGRRSATRDRTPSSRSSTPTATTTPSPTSARWSPPPT